MKSLWTPWRMEHVTGPGKPAKGCLFEPPGQESFSRKHLLLFRNDLCIVMLNRFPYANGHLLVAPVRHVADLTGLQALENAALMRLMQNCCSILRAHLKPHGINIGLNLGKVAGAGVDNHLHFHIVPRWDGDHNFMTVTAEIRTIPQHIENTFDMLLPDFQRLLDGGETL